MYVFITDSEMFSEPTCISILNYFFCFYSLMNFLTNFLKLFFYYSSVNIVGSQKTFTDGTKLKKVLSEAYFSP